MSLVHEKFLKSLVVVEGGCWEWQGGMNLRTGYGSLYVGGYKTVLVHRYSYQHYKGEIPAGLAIDHLCRNRKCANPDHLEAVTLGENVLRGVGVTAVNARKTHCHKGHEFTPENTYVAPTKGGRDCRECRYESGRKYRSKEVSYA